MRSDDRFGMRPVWDAILEVYDAFAKVCDKNGLRYYVSDGGALGAVRHGGFIPWDDNLDVSMPREDYEKFIELSKTELPPHLRFVNWKNTPEFTLLFGKVQDSRADKIRAIEEKTGRMLSNGIYIDIFPIDGYPNDSFFSKWVKYRDVFLLLVERFHLYKYSRLSSKGKRAWLLGMVLSVFVPWLRHQRQFLSLHEKTLLKYPFATSNLVGRACQRMNLFRRIAVPKEYWGSPVSCAFDGRQIMVPAQVKEHLINEYGETYMTPPPIEKQKPGHAYKWRCPWWLGPTGETNDGV